MPSGSLLPQTEVPEYAEVLTLRYTARDDWSLSERAGQCCFLCLDTPSSGQYAVLVPCLRPTKNRRLLMHYTQVISKSEMIYEKMTPWEKSCESDSDIYRRLVDTCYDFLGWWRRWLPFYGVIGVLEVKFQFAGVKESDGRYLIHMEPVNLDKVSEDCQTRIARHGTVPFADFDDVCLDEYYHSNACIIGMEEYSQSCIKQEAEEARRRQNRLLFLSQLKYCAQEPMRANGLHTLEGLAQKSCIYDVKDANQITLPVPYQKFRETEWIRGLHLIMGWHTDRMRANLPFRLSCASFGVVIVWLSLAVWKRGLGDWSTAFAFAQVVAASVSIIITSV